MNPPGAAHRHVRIVVPGAVLEADVGLPPQGRRGAVLFAHGSGSGRRSPRNRRIAAELNRAGLVTVLADLLTSDEERIDQRTVAVRFDIDLLAERVTAVTDWMHGSVDTAGLGIGLCAASTGAAAALVTAAGRPVGVQAVVSRGGRPDLAGARLPAVGQPTLLIVGGYDPPVAELNRLAARALSGENRLELVPRATHLFEEPGALEQVAGLARSWFLRHLRPPAADREERNR
jgi:putative phosphoribosyl transferase